MTFEEHRARLGHALLENGLLHYLADPPDAWRSAVRPVTAESPLCRGWAESTRSRPASLQRAVATWRGRSQVSEGQGIPDALRYLIRISRDGRQFEPSRRFPTDSEIERNLLAVEPFIVALEVRVEPTLVEAADFWNSVLWIHDFVCAIKISEDRFFEYFVRKA
jgi:hypothetical protein